MSSLESNADPLIIIIKRIKIQIMMKFIAIIKVHEPFDGEFCHSLYIFLSFFFRPNQMENSSGSDLGILLCNIWIFVYNHEKYYTN